MFDGYHEGGVERIITEAAGPVIRHAERYERAGGAANVAMNLAGLGCKTFLAGFWGSDSEQGELAALLERAGIDTGGGGSRSLPTISKTRNVGRVPQGPPLVNQSRGHPPGDQRHADAERGSEA